MNPILQSFIGSLVRYALVLLSAFAVKHGIFSQADAGKYVEAGVIFLVPVVWAWWKHYQDRVKFLTALMPGPDLSTETQILQRIKSGAPTPSVKTPPDTIPGVPASPVANSGSGPASVTTNESAK